MEALLYAEPYEVDNKLAELGLTRESLRKVVGFGFLAWTNCSENHPPLFAPIAAWAETVRALREYTITLGWKRCDANNYSRVIDPTGRIAIAVATGDEVTGCQCPERAPSTKTPKGPNTAEAVALNQFQFDLFPTLMPNRSSTATFMGRGDLATWILLIYRAHNEIRSELSLPSSIGNDDRVNGWRERILLPPILRDSASIDIAPPSQPDLDVEVKRRA